MKFLSRLVLQWQGINTEGKWKLGSGGDIESYLQWILSAVIGLAGLIAAAFIVFGAYTLITSSGEPENIAKGQKMVTNAVIGLVLAALAYLIVNFVIKFTPTS